MTEHIKISFPLKKDSDGYPPDDVERMWAVPLGDARYRLDNIPFFALGVSAEDVVIATARDGELVFESLAAEGGHSTVRVMCESESDVTPARESLREMGCSSELSHIPRLFAVDIPPEVNYAKVRAYLLGGRDKGKWDVQESCVAHKI